MRWEKAVERIAYGKPVRVKQVPVISDRAATVGVRLFQYTRARPFVWGMRRGKK